MMSEILKPWRALGPAKTQLEMLASYLMVTNPATDGVLA